MKTLNTQYLAIVQKLLSDRLAVHELTPCTVAMSAVSGDDLYVVINDHANKEYVYLKLLYGPENGFSHEVHERRVFIERGTACVYLAQQLLEEETGYARAD